MGNVINIKDYQPVDADKTRALFENRRNEFFETYGSEPREGEDSLISSLREVLKTNSVMAAKAFVAEKYGMESTGNAFESRRAGEELEKWIEAFDNAQEGARVQIKDMGYKDEDDFYDNIDTMLGTEK